MTNPKPVFVRPYKWLTHFITAIVAAYHAQKGHYDAAAFIMALACYLKIRGAE